MHFNLSVGEEFLCLGDVNSVSNKHYMELLGKKLVSHKSIKVVWFGGSNTHGRSQNPFVKQVQDMINIRYSTSSGREHTFLNRGSGGRTSCTFARGFKSSYFNMDAKGSDLIFLEHSMNDGVLSTDDRLRCFESLII